MARFPEVAGPAGIGSQGPEEPGLLDYLKILWRHKLIVVLTVVVATGTVVGLDTTRTKVYQGSAQILFNLQGSTSASSAGLTAANVATDVELISSTPVQAEVSKTLGVAAPAVSAAEVGTTNVAQITVHSTSPSFAAKAANAYADAYIKVETQSYINSQVATESQIQKQITSTQNQINAANKANGSSPTSQEDSQVLSLDSQLGSLQQQLSAVQLATGEGASAGQLVVPAVANPVPVSPKRSEDAVIAVGVGLLLGIGFALLRDHVDDRIRNSDDLEQAAFGLPTIGLIPVVSDWKDRKAPFLVTSKRPRSAATEAYRSLRTSVKFMSAEQPLKTLQITSSGATEGKTTTSTNLAFEMAESGQKVILVDCDLRRPRVHEFFDLKNEIGITSVLLGEHSIEEAVIEIPDNPDLSILVAGPIPPNPSELLSGEAASRVFGALSERYDMIVLDSSPVLPVTDAVALAAGVDGVLVVAAVGISTEKGIRRTLELLGRVDARLIGTVLNRAPESTYSYRYGYRYGYTYDAGRGGNSDGKISGDAGGSIARGNWKSNSVSTSTSSAGES